MTLMVGQHGKLESMCAGAVLTKMDGDSRGGAALSVKAVSGKPIKFVGTGEKLESLEVFYPDRIASRILGAHCSKSAPFECLYRRDPVLTTMPASLRGCSSCALLQHKTGTFPCC